MMLDKDEWEKRFFSKTTNTTTTDQNKFNVVSFIVGFFLKKGNVKEKISRMVFSYLINRAVEKDPLVKMTLAVIKDPSFVIDEKFVLVVCEKRLLPVLKAIVMGNFNANVKLENFNDLTDLCIKLSCDFEWIEAMVFMKNEIKEEHVLYFKRHGTSFFLTILNKKFVV